ncbi:cytochrome P450 [Trametes elegans]|nr:cytochrome P450 [Trametes elegans]
MSTTNLAGVNAPVVFLAVLAIALYLGSTARWRRWRARTRGRPLPPGPRRLPVLGNMLSIPTWKPWLGFRDISARYGEITYLEVLGQSMLVLESPALMSELLDKHSANTSDRNLTPLIPLSGQASNFAFMPYGQVWRQHRRAFWQYFHPGSVAQYQPIQRAVTRRFLEGLLARPAEFKKLIQFNFTATMMKLTYGIDLDGPDDKYVAIVDDAFLGLREVTVTAQFLLEFFPWVQYLPKWVPGTSFLRELDRGKGPSDYTLRTPFDEAKERALVEGGDHRSIVSELLSRFEGGEEREEEEKAARGVAAVAVEGGSDTTASTMQGLFLALSLHPEVQEKARAELDIVVGRHRLPDFDDRDSLVYIDAIVKETLRWHIVVPLGVSHRVMEDDEFHGYFLPAGTTVVTNVWACMHNPEIYPEPDRFLPERFIRDGKLDAEVLDPATVVFGICPGRHLAEAALFLAVACVLHVFEVGPPLDENGKPVMIQPEQGHGFLSYPEDCRCTIKPRSAEAVALTRGSQNDSGVI